MTKSEEEKLVYGLLFQLNDFASKMSPKEYDGDASLITILILEDRLCFFFFFNFVFCSDKLVTYVEKDLR